jgi:S1 RNA binding domain protein
MGAADHFGDTERGPEIADLEVGAVVEGTVQRITPYGAFLQLEGGRVGLVHISEIDRNYVKDVRDHLRESDVVQAKVITIKDDGKIDLSIKALQDPQPRIERRRGSDPEFEQKLKKFLRSSDERQVEYRRSMDHKRR